MTQLEQIQTRIKPLLPRYTKLVIWRKCDQDIGVKITVDEVTYYASYGVGVNGGINHLLTYTSKGDINQEVLTQLEILK